MTTYPLPSGTIDACVQAARAAAAEHDAGLVIAVRTVAEVAAASESTRSADVWESIARACAAETIRRLVAVGWVVESKGANDGLSR